MTARLIAIDWGTTSFRAAVADEEGHVLERTKSPTGILAAAGRFPEVLAAAVHPLLQRHGALPVLMCGMIGSRQGWHEAPYVHAPARLGDLASGIAWLDAAGIGRIGIVPGVDVHPIGGAPDVMRGEETQVAGAMRLLGLADATIVHPGTHAKWIRVEAGAIVDFATFMTGEVFAALTGHTILGRMMDLDAPLAEAAFVRGVDATAPGGLGPGALLSLLFSARTLSLFDQLASAEGASYLSGLLVGAEMREARRRFASADIVVAGAHELEMRYALAARHLGIPNRSAPPECAVAGLVAVARAAGII
jgi:2-dehydro-3-deoxygalactonokinase